MFVFFYVFLIYFCRYETVRQKIVVVNGTVSRVDLKMKREASGELQVFVLSNAFYFQVKQAVYPLSTALLAVNEELSEEKGRSLANKKQCLSLISCLLMI